MNKQLNKLHIEKANQLKNNNKQCNSSDDDTHGTSYKTHHLPTRATAPRLAQRQIRSINHHHL